MCVCVRVCVCRFIGVCVNEGQVHALVEVSRRVSVETTVIHVIVLVELWPI